MVYNIYISVVSIIALLLLLMKLWLNKLNKHGLKYGQVNQILPNYNLFIFYKFTIILKCTTIYKIIQILLSSINKFVVII